MSKFRFAVDGWDWQAPITASRTAWVKLSIAQQGMSIPGLDMTWRLRDGCAGPGYFLVGDSALMLDPSSSHGILRALMMGILAAHAAHAISSALLPEGLAIQAYCDWVRLHAKTETDRLTKLYEQSAAGLLFQSTGKNLSKKVM